VYGLSSPGAVTSIGQVGHFFIGAASSTLKDTEHHRRDAPLKETIRRRFLIAFRGAAIRTLIVKA
jgi:hypothetical protein